MKRQQEAELRKKLEDEQRKKIDESHWVVEGFESESFPTVSIMNESTFDFSVGRRSFNSFNPSVEVILIFYHADHVAYNNIETRGRGIW